MIHQFLVMADNVDIGQIHLLTNSIVRPIVDIVSSINCFLMKN